MSGKFAVVQGAGIIELIVDGGKSAKNLDRPGLLERFQKRGVSLVSVAESLDTGGAAGRLVINIMTAVSQWERSRLAQTPDQASQST